MHKSRIYDFLPLLDRGPRGRTTEQVERALRSAIVDLQFEPGELIDKALVCERLGVSRFPVSEALGRLAAEGLVEIRPQRGSHAARIRLREVMEAMLIRRALEGLVAEIAAERLPEEALADLDQNLGEQRKAVAGGDRTRFYALDLAFHEILVAGLDLPRVGAVIDASRANVDRVRRLLSSPRRHAVTLAEHETLVAAIRSRRKAAARKAMEAHLDAVLDELDRFSRLHPEVFVGD